jgi:hypothetical protein
MNKDIVKFGDECEEKFPLNSSKLSEKLLPLFFPHVDKICSGDGVSEIGQIVGDVCEFPHTEELVIQ